MSSNAKSVAAVLGCLALAALAAGCAGDPVHIDNYVPAGIDRGRGRVVEGSAGSFQLLILFPIRNGSRHARAWERLVEKAPNCWITDVQLKESWFYGFVGTGYHSTFRATAYPKDGSAALPGPEGEPAPLSAAAR